MKRTLPIMPIAIGLMSMQAHANIDCPDQKSDALTIEDARLYIEDNVPDRDVGVHGFFGDTAWRILCVFGPDGQELISFEPRGALGDLGAAEFFFESNEPPYDDWGYDALKANFPAGEYEVRALNVDGTVATGTAVFTTLVAEAPEILEPKTSRDEDGELPVSPFDDLLVRWKPSVKGRSGGPVAIAGYQIILTHNQWEGSGDNFAKPSFSVHLGPDRTELLVPKGFFDADTVYELEVIAIEESGNQTIAGVSFFRTGT